MMMVACHEVRVDVVPMFEGAGNYCWSAVDDVCSKEWGVPGLVAALTNSNWGVL